MSDIIKFNKRVEEILDYSIDFSDFLTENSDSIASFGVEVPVGLTLDSSTLVGGIITLWISGGALRGKYLVRSSITTTAGRVKVGVLEINIIV